MKEFSHDLAAMRDAVTDRTRLFFVASPNNPTGGANSVDDLVYLAQSLPDHVIFVSTRLMLNTSTRLGLGESDSRGTEGFCLRTFSKIYGLGGLRVGYGYGNPELVQVLQRVRQPFNVNSVAQAAAQAALSDYDFTEMCCRENERGRKVLCEGLGRLGYETYGGAANFVLTRVGDGLKTFQWLQENGLIVRPLAPYGMPEYVRVTIGRAEENERLLEKMAEFATS